MKNIILTLLVISLSFGGASAQTNANNPAPSSQPMIFDTSEVFGDGVDGKSKILDIDTNLVDYTLNDSRSRIDGGNTDPDQRGAFFIRNIVSTLLGFLELMLVPVGIVLLIRGAIVLLLNRGDEEKFKEKIRQLVWTAAGFFLLAFSFVIVDRIFFGYKGEIFQDGNFLNFAQFGVSEIAGFINFISTFAVAVAVAFVVLGAIRLIIAGENEEAQGKIKKQIIFAVIGILLISIANILASIFFTGNGAGGLTVNADALIIKITQVINVILGFIALGAVIAIIWAGVQMIIHFGNEDMLGKSKKIIIYAVVGLILAFSSYTIVRFFITPGINSESLSNPADQLLPFDAIQPQP